MPFRYTRFLRQMSNPKVFFDITADGSELGRIVMEVLIANDSCVPMLFQKLPKTLERSALVKRALVTKDRLSIV